MSASAVRPRTTPRRNTGNLVLNAAGAVLLLAVLVLVTIKIGERGTPFFVRTLLGGIALGAIYALVALGYTMVYGIVELINFAHGDVFAFGAMLSWVLVGSFGLRSAGWEAVLPLLAIAIIVMLACGTLNVAIERLAYRPLRNAPRLAPLITAIGMSSLLEGLMYIWQGPATLTFPNLLPAYDIPLGGGITLPVKQLIVIVGALVLAGGLNTFISRSMLGKAMRATAQDRDAAQLMGIDINLTIAVTFFIGAILAGAGGLIYGLYIGNTDFFVGFTLGLIAFTAAVFGGIGNFTGAALGGLMIGIIRFTNDTYFNSAATEVLIFSILILTLVFRPTGLLGMRVPEK